jgi:hypothetical protein
VELEGGREQQEQLHEERLQQAEYAVEAEKSKPHAGVETCVEDRKEALHNLVQIGM